MKKKKGSLLSRTPNKPYRLYQSKHIKRQFLVSRHANAKPRNLAAPLFFAILMIALMAAWSVL